MTLDEIKALDLAGIEKRMSEIRNEIDTDGADIDALTAEVDAIEARKNELKANAKKFKDIKDKVSAEKRTALENHKEMEKMDVKEVRNSKEYIHAYANYIKTGKDAELRSILTENAAAESTAKIPVPEIVVSTISHAWGDLKILSRVTRTELKGVVKVGVETQADDAQIHKEGTAAVTEESLTLKIVSMVPETIKKYITVSDETLDMDDGAFLEYVYSELAHKIFKKAEDTVVADIVADTDKLTVTMEPAGTVTDFINAVSKLSDEATNPVVIMNKQSYAYYKGLAMASNYAVDPFDGMEVLFNNTLSPVTGTTITKGNYAVVGDLRGYQVNFPNGTDVSFKYDDLSLAEKDLVKIVGRLPIGHGVVSFKHFVSLKKA